MSSKNKEFENSVMQVGRIEINPQDFNMEPDINDIPILATRNLVLFPGVTIPINITRESSLKVAELAAKEHIPVAVFCQTDPSEDNPTISKGLMKYGVVADVFQVIELPDGAKTALVRGRERARLTGKGEGKRAGIFSAKIKISEDFQPTSVTEFEVTIESITSVATKIFEDNVKGDFNFSGVIASIDNPVDRLNFIATNLPAPPDEKIKLLAEKRLGQRAILLLALLMNEEARQSVAREIMEKAASRMQENHRQTVLQMQLDTIKEELYGDTQGDDIEILAERAEDVRFPDEVREFFDKELRKMQRLNPSTPDYSVQYAFLETLIELPWDIKTQNETSISVAEETLDADHFGLEKVKERILEQIAVILNNPNAKSPIICLVGPPGVGKTSLGQSIAKSMGRNYQRVSLGGVHDESEIRGHRRTYVGAMPGRIIKAIKAAEVCNPVLLLDEIDKIGKDYKGDPSAALLEVLDPEQNVKFHDNYLDVDFSLQDVLFIATANTLDTIQPALRDRMEIIEISGYSLEEKVEIAQRYLIPKALKDNGVSDNDLFKLDNDTIAAIIEQYTSESGVRTLQNRISTLVRKSLLAAMRGKELPERIRPEHLEGLLGLPIHRSDKYEGNDIPGVVTGLAWTQVGGEILLAEASLSSGKGNRLTITGNLGDVMKESATIAFQWVKANAEKLGIPVDSFDKHDLHIHFPEGAIPKDGPSAGITIATAIASVFTGCKVRERLAMTGEITLRGKVLPVGGIKEKILAAKRAGITDIIISNDNRRDIEDIPARYRDGLTFHYVTFVKEVIEFALLK